MGARVYALISAYICNNRRHAYSSIVAERRYSTFVQKPETFISPSYKEQYRQDRNACKVYYRAQTVHDFETSSKKVHIAIWIARGEPSLGKDLDSSWISHIKNAIVDINEAAPRLHLHLVSSKNDEPNIAVFGNSTGCYTTGNIFQYSGAIVKLEDTWPDQEKKGTGLHELLHALGFQHEHQRPDAEGKVNVCEGLEDPEWRSQYQILHHSQGITRFDPLSIMFYSEDKKLKRISNDIIWKLKSSPARSNRLSELDKVGLNIVFPPCRTDKYNPKISDVTGFYYCGRPVMKYHNYPAENTTDGYCGPNDWANCPACRTLKCPAVDDMLKKGKWQGMSGLVYCGRFFGCLEDGHDGYCGPDNGSPCPQCARILCPILKCTVS